jgi:hypothetical protein
LTAADAPETIQEGARGTVFSSHLEGFMARARSVEIYLKPGIDEDDQVFEIWSALRSRGRPQDTFRRAIRLGLLSMAQGGELARAGLEVLDPDLLGTPAPAKEPVRRGRKARVRTAKPDVAEKVDVSFEPVVGKPLDGGSFKENEPPPVRKISTPEDGGYSFKEDVVEAAELVIPPSASLVSVVPAGADVSRSRVKLGKIM